MFYLQITTVLIYGGCLAISSFILLCLVLLVFTKPHPVIRRHKEERYFKNWETDESLPFPSLSDSSTLHLSVVVPAYNEEARLPPMLDECLKVLEERRKESPSYTYEVIIVNDGSKDKTVQVAGEYSKKYGCNTIRVLDLVENRGKGGAVRLGAMSSRGALILFADADGATKFSELSKLEETLECFCKKNYKVDPKGVSDSFGIAIGSRAHLEDEAIATRSFFRTILMYGFHMLVWFFGVKGIKDTQCGFKVLTREAARRCFHNMHIERWAFDVELLYIAQQLNIPIGEEAVIWTEIDGSKIVPLWSWLQMGKDLGLMWLRYRIGAWKLKDGRKI